MFHLCAAKHIHVVYSTCSLSNTRYQKASQTALATIFALYVEHRPTKGKTENSYCPKHTHSHLTSWGVVHSILTQDDYTKQVINSWLILYVRYVC